jgi:hypothetical protein
VVLANANKSVVPGLVVLANANTTNEAVRRENHEEKNLYIEKNNHHDPGGHERCKDSITIRKV